MEITSFFNFINKIFYKKRTFFNGHRGEKVTSFLYPVSGQS